MISVRATNIISPLGFDTMTNCHCVRQGRSALRPYTDARSQIKTFVAGFSDEDWERLSVEGFTRFESLVIRSVSEALKQAADKGRKVDLLSPRTRLIISTAKANVRDLGSPFGYSDPGESAARIATRLGFAASPIVVCNACISALTAQVLADRLIGDGVCDTAVVCGADVLSDFLLIGFNALKALSEEPCRPFDMDRSGLNLGEAAATIIYSSTADAGRDEWKLVSSYLSNDAYHTVTPDPTGKGLCTAIEKTLEGFDIHSLALINAHGTSTLFNDQMESRAIADAGLSEVPVTSLKGIFGHTMGAGGILESIIIMNLLDEGTIPATKGFSELGVSGRINVVSRELSTDKLSFIKTMSGFGGSNAAAIFSRLKLSDRHTVTPKELISVHKVHITPEGASLDCEPLSAEGTGAALILSLYRKYVGDWPRFHKADPLSKLLCVASALLMKDQKPDTGGETAIIIFNRTSSILEDLAHLESYRDQDSFYPSPSIFSYTIPNVSCGEVAIRFRATGENTLVVLPRRDNEIMESIIEEAVRVQTPTRVICGWLDRSGEDVYEADIELRILK